MHSLLTSNGEIAWHLLRRAILHEADPHPVPTFKLPMLPLAIRQFAEAVKREDVTHAELVRIIESDAGVTASLMKFANSATNASTYPVKSASGAISRIGLRRCTLYLMTSGLKAALPKRSSTLIHHERFWAANLERATFARKLAEAWGHDSELAFAAAMLQDFLLPLTAAQNLDEYVSYLEEPGGAASLRDFEETAFGWDHATAAALVMHGWGFPDDLVCAVALHHRHDQIALHDVMRRSVLRCVSAASLLPDAMLQTRDPWQRLRVLQDAEPEVDLLAIAAATDSELADADEVISAKRSPLAERLHRGWDALAVSV